MRGGIVAGDYVFAGERGAEDPEPGHGDGDGGDRQEERGARER